MKTVVLNVSNQQDIIDQTIKIIKVGGLVIFPSDTVYGLLVDATNQQAVEKLIAFKNRPAGKAISVFVSDMNMLQNYVYVDRQQLTLLKRLFPGPFTIILKSKHQLVKLLESEKKTLGIRIPDYPLINQLVKKFTKPITATSANLSYDHPYYNVLSLLKSLSTEKKQLIDLIVDAGDLPHNKPSTIIDITKPEVKILRQGDIIFKDIKTLISNSPNQTKKIANYIIKKLSITSKALVLIIEGELGVGKTIFVKGIGEYFDINNIISPSYVVYYEYILKNQLFSKLIHFDLYNIQEQNEFKYLGIENNLKPGNLLVFEWGEKAGDLLPMLKQKARIIYIKINYIDLNKREINLKY